MGKKSDITVTNILSPRGCREAIQTMFETGRALFMWGAPGIAKSDTVKQFCNSASIAAIDIRLSQMDPTDLRGIPYPVSVGGVQGVEWSAPLVLPRNIEVETSIEVLPAVKTVKFYNPKGVNKIHYCTEPKITAKSLTKGLTAVIAEKGMDFFKVYLTDGTKDEAGEPNMFAGEVYYTVSGEAKALIALEEFNSAPQSVQAAAYQLVLDRRLGEYEVPEGCYLMALGNRDTDKGVTFKMPTPIMNRFDHIEMRVDEEEWITWAIENQIHPEVIGYISHFTQNLHQFDPSTASRGFPTPRSWHFVSDILYKGEKTTSEEVLRALVTGAIGEGVGIQFVEFRKGMAHLPNPDDILSGKITKMPNEKTEAGLAYALVTTLCYRLKNSLDELTRAHSLSNKATALSETKEFEEWLKRADNFLRFAMENFAPEIAIMGAKAALRIHSLPFESRRMPAFKKFAGDYRELIL